MRHPASVAINYEIMKYYYAFKTIRKHRKLTQKQLADFAGVSPGYISKIEKGEKVPTLEVIEKICSGTGVPFALFALLSSEPKPDAVPFNSDIEIIKQSLVDMLPDGLKTAKA